MKRIRVLVIDDSPVVQSVLSKVLSSEPDIEVVGAAADPFEARDWILRDPPDVITLDVEMPQMDGVTFLKRLMSFRPLPCIMVSSYTRENSHRTLEALEAGAVDFIPKPLHDVKNGLAELKGEIAAKIRAAAKANVKRPIRFARRKKTVCSLPGVRSSNIVIVIGASTGGTEAVRKVLEAMPRDVNGIVIVQHMPGRFTGAFAQRLNDIVPMNVREAKNGDRVETGIALVAPGGLHVLLNKDKHGYYITLKEGIPVSFQRPSIDVLFSSVAKVAGKSAIGVLLTGMGSDGAVGLMAMKDAGAFTVAQDENTSLVFGMPRSAIELGAVEKVVPLDDIGQVILDRLRAGEAI